MQCIPRHDRSLWSRSLHRPTGGHSSEDFVPYDDGVSHNEAENITSEQAGRGASVLLGATIGMVG